MSKDIIHDLSQHLQQQVGDVITRQLPVFRMVLEPVDIARVLAELAVSTCLTAAATTAAMGSTDEEVAALYDATMTLIKTGVEGDRARAMSKIAEAQAQRDGACSNAGRQAA